MFPADCHYLLCWFEDMFFGLRKLFAIGEFELSGADLVSIFDIDVEFSLWCHQASILLYVSCLQGHARSRGDFDMVVNNERGGGTFVVFDNATDMIHCRLGSSTLTPQEKSLCKGIILRAILLTHLLDDSFAYDVTRLLIVAS